MPFLDIHICYNLLRIYLLLLIYTVCMYLFIYFKWTDQDQVRDCKNKYLRWMLRMKWTVEIRFLVVFFIIKINSQLNLLEVGRNLTSTSLY